MFSSSAIFLILLTTQSQTLELDPNPNNRAIFSSASAKWTEAIVFEKAGNEIPAALSLQSAIRLTGQIPKPSLTGGDLLFIAQLETAHARVRYRLVTIQPNADTWKEYLQAADEAKVAIDAAGHVLSTGQPAGSLVILRGQIELMNCNYKTAAASADYAAQLYPAGKNEFARFTGFVKNAERSGNGPCANAGNARTAEWKEYGKQLMELAEFLQKVQSIVK